MKITWNLSFWLLTKTTKQRSMTVHSTTLSGFEQTVIISASCDKFWGLEISITDVFRTSLNVSITALTQINWQNTSFIGSGVIVHDSKPAPNYVGICIYWAFISVKWCTAPPTTTAFDFMILKPMVRDTRTAGPMPSSGDWTQSNALHILASASSTALTKASSGVDAL